MQVHLRICRRTEMAVAAHVLSGQDDSGRRAGRLVWLPKSVVDISEDGNTIVDVPEWLANRHGLTPQSESAPGWRRIPVPAGCVWRRDGARAVRIDFPAGSALAGFSAWVPAKLARPEGETFCVLLPEDLRKSATKWDRDLRAVVETREISAEEFASAFSGTAG